MSNGNQEGGVTFSGSGSVNVQGDVVGRDKVTTAGAKVDEIAKLYESLTAQVKALAPADKQGELEQKIALLEEQTKSKSPDLNVVGGALKWIKKNVPGASTILKTLLNQPIVGAVVKGAAQLVLDDE